MSVHPARLPGRGDLIGGRYRVEALLGQGGMGAVFGAVNVATGRAVAIKWMLPEAAASPEAMARFMAEARATARIEHPNVIGVLDVGEDRGAPFLVMERLRGESLADRLRRGRLAVVEALDCLVPACRGVAEAHAEGVIHRDLKPDNIFLCDGKDGSARTTKVLDFGISKLTEHENAAPVTQTGIAIGTPSYMSPEQLNAPREVDPRFDVYAMGVVLYQSLTGRLPYDAEGLFQLVQQIAAGQPRPLRELAPDVPDELAAIVMRAMHTRRELRHASMKELADELAAIRMRYGASHGPEPLPPHAVMTPPPHGSHAVHVPPPAAPAPRRSGLPIVALALAGMAVLFLFLAGAGGVYFFTRGEHGASSGASSGLPGPTGTSADPLRPRVDLTFGGDCHPRFEGSLSVSSSQARLLTVAGVEQGRPVGTLSIAPGQASTAGTITLDEATFNQTAFTVQVGEGGTGGWGNWRSGFATTPGWPITGSVTFRRYEPERGIADVTFDDVTLQSWSTSTLCRVQGRLQTFGLTWGDAH